MSPLLSFACMAVRVATKSTLLRGPMTGPRNMKSAASDSGVGLEANSFVILISSFSEYRGVRSTFKPKTVLLEVTELFYLI